MSEAQIAAFCKLIVELEPDEFHHGDCIGADDQAAEWVNHLLTSAIVKHPPIDQGSDYAGNPYYDDIREPKTHFARNRDIVNETDCLIAAPLTDEPQERGGTWYTINYAKKQGKTVYQLER